MSNLEGGPQLYLAKKVLFIEPYYVGSHKAFIDVLIKCKFLCYYIVWFFIVYSHLDIKSYEIVSLPGKKWHWVARCGALMIYDKIPKITSEQILFCSSVLSLAELLGLRPDLHNLKKIVYFHENQLVYPVKEIKTRDIQYAHNQITTW